MPDPAQTTEFARTLRNDFAAIDDQFAATEDPGGNIARARMTLVYGSEVTDAFFALLEDTIVLDVAYEHPQPALEPAIVAADSRIAYDDFRHRLSYTGLLSTTKRDALKAAGPAPSFQSAVDAIFAKSEDARGSFFSRHPELRPLFDAYVASSDPIETKRRALLAAFSPELSKRRKRQQALQRLSAAANTDLSSTQTLLDPAPPFPLHTSGDANRPALDDFIAIEKPGLAVSFFFRDTATGTVDLHIPAEPNVDYSIGRRPLPANPTPGAAISGIWTGKVETPETGFYNFVVEADSGATVTLSLDGQARALTPNGTIWRNSDPLELTGGALHGIVLTVNRVMSTLSLKWETPKRAREVIPGRYLYPPASLPPFNDAYVRFFKTASLAQALRLTANELSRFATHSDYQIAGDGWLNALAVTGEPVPATAAALLRPLRDLLDFAHIKTEISPEDESLLTLLRDPATGDTNGLLYTLTRWDKASVSSLLVHFGISIVDLAHFNQFRRVYDVFLLLQKMGILASALIKGTTNEPNPATVVDLQAALRARYETESWRSVVQPINDEMRALQRDALVAYILHQMSLDSDLDHIDTADKLFEYFLMDVQMAPCMQTSRIRHALSSVQLFIERCFMNLEPRVSFIPPSLIEQADGAPNKAKQWEWMKRYRVWEANRKIFLFPENWLEPELRDDKSPFFKEVESELLQGDITEDKAAVALLNYLSKLEEVAKLEPCGIHHAPANQEQRTGEVNHVIARTAGASRKYYYRRFEYGYWTPWEHVKLDIEDNPVIPVVWKGRLLLFWLRILKEAPVDPTKLPDSSGPTGPIRDLTLSAIRSDANSKAQQNARVRAQAVLCWSEYYNGKWQPAKTSEIERPLQLDRFDPAGSGAFNRSKLQLRSYELADGTLAIHVGGQGSGTFFMYNTHSLPVRGEDAIGTFNFELPEPVRRIDLTDAEVVITYGDGLLHLNPGGGLSVQTFNRKVLENRFLDRVVVPDHPMPDRWDAPFFYEDGRHVFYVTTTEKLVEIPIFTGVAVDPGDDETVLIIPPFVVEDKPLEFPDLDGGDPFDPGFLVNPAEVRRFITEDANIRQGIGATGSIKFGDIAIGPQGAIKNSSVKI